MCTLPIKQSAVALYVYAICICDMHNRIYVNVYCGIIWCAFSAFCFSDCAVLEKRRRMDIYADSATRVASCLTRHSICTTYVGGC